MDKEPELSLDAVEFYQFVREERLFCAVLAHLLWQQGPNLSNFLRLINDKLPEKERVPFIQAEAAQVYIEFSYLRDHWESLGRDNEAKRQRISTLLSRVPSLGHHLGEFPQSIPDFNDFFMGQRGKKIMNDIAYPGQWSVKALRERFNSPQEFRDVCKFKWAFNIKPDLVILLPNSKPLCIEAKLESREGWYPTNRTECELFDNLFGHEKGRVGQIELQQFMFANHVERPCLSVAIVNGRTAPLTNDKCVVVRWDEVFGTLDFGSSLAFVRKLVQENRHLQVRSV